MAFEPLETAFASGYPTVQQLSVFMDNGVGQLARMTKLFSNTEIHILGLSVVNAVECAIVRMIVDAPDEAHHMLKDAGFAITQADVLVVALPPGKHALLQTWVTLLGAECSIAYTYPLLARPGGLAALAVQADSPEQAAEALQTKGFSVLDQSDLAYEC